MTYVMLNINSPNIRLLEAIFKGSIIGVQIPKVWIIHVQTDPKRYNPNVSFDTGNELKKTYEYIVIMTNGMKSSTKISIYINFETNKFHASPIQIS